MRTLETLCPYAAAVASIVFGAAALPALGQGSLADDSLRYEVPLIPPIDSILAIGVSNSPRVRGRQAIQRKLQHELNRVRNDWLDGISIGAGTTYGSFGNEFLTQVYTGFNVGLNVRWSLFDLFGRRDATGILEQELVVAYEKERETVQDERADLIRLYSDLLLAQRLVVVNGEAWSATSVHREMANAEFVQGDIPVSELARVTEISTKSQALFETARAEYLKRYMQLENRLGVSLESLL